MLILTLSTTSCMLSPPRDGGFSPSDLSYETFETTFGVESPLLNNAVVINGFAVGLPDDWIIYYPQRMLSGADRSGLVELSFASPDESVVGAMELARLSPGQTGIGVERLFTDMAVLAERRGVTSSTARYLIRETEYYLVREVAASGQQTIQVLMIPPHSRGHLHDYEGDLAVSENGEYEIAFLQLRSSPDQAPALDALLPSLMNSLRYLGPEWNGRYRSDAPSFVTLQSGLHWIGDLPGGVVISSDTDSPNSFSLAFFHQQDDANSRWFELEESDIELGSGASEFFFGTDLVRMEYSGTFRPGSVRVRALLVHGSFMHDGIRYGLLLRTMWGDRETPTQQSWHADFQARGYQTLLSYHVQPEGAILP